MEQLVAAVLTDPVAALHGRSPAADALVALGAPALPLVRRVLGGAWASDAHPKDVLEASCSSRGASRAGGEAKSSRQLLKVALQLTR